VSGTCPVIQLTYRHTAGIALRQLPRYLALQMSTLIKLRASFLFAAFLLIIPHTRAQSLVYAVSYGETRASFHARFPTGALGASNKEKLAMLRSYRKTEIYSVSMIVGKRTLVFSDEGMDFEIVPANPAIAAGKAYVVGVEREWRTVPNPGAYADPPAIYEISLDGANKVRRLFAVRPNQTSIEFNREASKAAFETFEDGKYLVFIYEVPSWKLLHKWELTSLLNVHCPACLPISSGWLADGNRLFFNLDLGAEDDDDDSTSTAAKVQEPPGTYLASDDGADFAALLPHAIHLEFPGYAKQSGTTPYLIGQLSDGSYLFRDFALRKDPAPKPPVEFEPFLVQIAPHFSVRKLVPLKKLRLATYALSPSGRYLAYVEDRQIPNYRTERHLWAMDLRSGAETELFVAPPPNPPSSLDSNVTLTIVGWQ
jgi:hypothetical protein